MLLSFILTLQNGNCKSTTKDNSIMNGDQKLGNKVTIKVIKE